MKKTHFWLSVLAIMVLVACNSENEEIIAGSDEYVVVNATVLLPNEKGSRVVGLPDNSTDGWFDYQWDGNKDQTVYVFFRSGTTTGVSTATFKVPTGYHPINNPKPGGKGIELKIPKPTNFTNLSNFQISGAMGVESMNTSGVCTINPPTSIDGSNQNYNLPFYFPVTEVKDNFAKVDFKTYGSLLRVVFHAKKGETESNFTSLYLKTSVISTKGTFSVNGATGEPAFAVVETGPTETVSTNDSGGRTNYRFKTGDTYTLQNVSATAAKPAVVFIWGYPTPVAQIPPLTSTTGEDEAKRVVQVQTNYGTNVLYYQNSTKWAWETAKTYTMNVKYKQLDLIFTAVVNTVDLETYYEIYNPTDANVNLKGYYFHDPMLHKTLDLTNTEQLINYRVPSTGADVLGSKQFMVIYCCQAPEYSDYNNRMWFNKISGFTKKVINSSGNPNRYIGTYVTYARNQFLGYKDPDGTNILFDAIPCGRSGLQSFKDYWSGTIAAGLPNGTGIKRYENDNTPSTIFDLNKWKKTGLPSPTDISLVPNRRINFGYRWYSE